MTKVYKYYYDNEGDIHYKTETLTTQSHVLYIHTDLDCLTSSQNVRIDQYTVNTNTLELEQTKTSKPKPNR